ncbi:MAG: DNA-protecting protein DprA [Ignavibacteriae bacterium]|nr:DNA-protecting protein DprA [Ignavibacteriota bacterium]
MKEDLETFTKLRILLDVDGIGPGKLFNLLSKFNSLDNLINANYNQLLSVDGISQTLANKILIKIDEYFSFQKTIEIELNQLEKINAEWVTFWSDNYPSNLKNIFAPPIILYYKGTLLKQDENSVAIVGTRMPTNYGKKYAYDFAKELSTQGITIVSGLARGVDSSAHWGSAENNGRTIAIIGSGLDIIYPYENKKLFHKIIENGAVISEYSLGTKPDAPNFPKRNRIISGISLGTLVIETKSTGGALQTAAYALEQNKEVFAIPGNLGNFQSEGTNTLIQKGEAKLVRNINDILIELNLKIAPKIGENIPKPNIDLNIFEQKIYDLLSDKPKHIDIISSESKINSSECLVNLLSLEFRDIVKQLPGKVFVKV